MTIEELKNKKISYISLGCDKNRVDLEEMMAKISDFGLEMTNIENADVVIVNTCAFILPARQEAINNILEMAELKKRGKLEKVIVTGCLNQRYLDELKAYLPEVDAFVPIKENENIVEIIAESYDLEIEIKKKKKAQKTMLPNHYAYLKISDGCNNCCSYCTIPRIRGRYRSIPFEEVIQRAKELVASGAKELIIVAQDVTRYGIDLYKKYRLVELLQEISKIKNLRWIRLHYLYPELVNDELLEEIHNNKKICKYLDIPLQHIDDGILKSMNRRADESQIRTLINKIRTKYPEISLRSTFIVGYPGETRHKFNKLLTFLKQTKLEQVGFFPYSREEGTRAFYLKGQVFEFIKQKRAKKAEEIQSKIAYENNLNQIGKVVEVLVDEFDSENGCYNARMQTQSPNVDFFVKIDCSENVKIGEFCTVQLIDYEGYSFLGTTIF